MAAEIIPVELESIDSEKQVRHFGLQIYKRLTAVSVLNMLDERHFWGVKSRHSEVGESIKQLLSAWHQARTDAPERLRTIVLMSSDSNEARGLGSDVPNLGLREQNRDWPRTHVVAWPRITRRFGLSSKIMTEGTSNIAAWFAGRNPDEMSAGLTVGYTALHELPRDGNDWTIEPAHDSSLIARQAIRDAGLTLVHQGFYDDGENGMFMPLLSNLYAADIKLNPGSLIPIETTQS